MSKKAQTSQNQTTAEPQLESDESTVLDPRQELFCLYYAKYTETFDNATLSYAEAYGYDLDSMSPEPQKDDEGNVIGLSERSKAINTCAAAGSRLLRNVKIQDRIQEIYLTMGTDFLDREMTWMAGQRGDLTAKGMAIRELNRVKGRITDKVKVEKDLSEEEIDAIIARRMETSQS